MKEIYLLACLVLLTDIQIYSQKVLDVDKTHEINTQERNSSLQDIGVVPPYSLGSVFENTPTGEEMENWSRMLGLELDQDGNLYHLGSFSGKVSGFGTEIQGEGLFLIKTTAQGETVWKLIFEQEHPTTWGYGKIIKVDAEDGTVYVAGNTEDGTTVQGIIIEPQVKYSGFLAKVSTEGQVKWVQRMPYEVQGIDLDSDKNVYCSGYYSGDFALGNIQAHGVAGDAFLIKLNADGEPQWGRFFGGEDVEYSGLVAIDKEDNIYFSGEFISRNIKLTGSDNLTLDENDGNILLLKLDTEGNIIWSEALASGDYPIAAFPTSLEVAPDGNIILNGWVGYEATFGSISVSSPYGHNNFVASIDPDGNTSWVKVIKTDYTPFNYNEMGVDEAGNIYVGGEIDGFLDFGEENTVLDKGIYFAKYFPDGTFSYAKIIEASEGLLQGIAISSNDDVFFNGQFKGEANLNGETYFSGDSTTAFLVNLSHLPDEPETIEGQLEVVMGETTTFTLVGKGLADEVILEVSPSDALNEYRIEGDQLIITWNDSFLENSGGKIAGGSANRINNSVEVTISIAYRNNTGTSDFSTFKVYLSDQVTGLEEEIFKGAISIYPNPSVSFINIELPQSQPKAVDIILYNISGKIIDTYILPVGSTSIQISTDRIANGAYFLQFSLRGDGTTTRIFLKN